MQTQVVNISLPKRLLEEADYLAKEELRSRSELFREAIRSYILRETRLGSVFTYGERKAKKLNIKDSNIERLVDEYRQGR